MPVGSSPAAVTPVLIVGAGPCGATLALELAHHGVQSVVVERSLTASAHPKMDYLNGRTMELLRRLGVVEEIRRLGVAPDHQFDFRWARDLRSPSIAVWDYPSVDGLRERYAAVNDGTAMLEPYQRLQGSLFEDVLRRRIRSHPLIDVREGWRFEDADQEPGGASAQVVCEASGEDRTLTARYVVGCDGAGSTVRHRLGIGVDAQAPPTRHCDVYFRSADPALTSHGRFFLTILAVGITLVSRDGRDTWTATVQLPDGRAPADPVAVVEATLGLRLTAAAILNVSLWEGRLAVSRAYRQGSFFLAGDAAHQFYPTGGHGANTGIGDAVDLGWKLAARVNGWGGDGLLDSYEAERRPVALFNRAMCANLLDVWRRFPLLAAEGAPAELLAGYLREESYQIDNAGVHFGNRYDDSPVVCGETGPAPAWHWRAITPATWPGGRVPSVRLADGSALFDHLGPELSLVDCSDGGAGRHLEERARRRGIPLSRVVVQDAGVRRVWERDLVLVRPDQHVAWRGDEPPADCDALLDRITGR
jgi:2-polyprenyl-6-methoxyphenol hydroxylase-like FAD-dependent oxidoreductase